MNWQQEVEDLHRFFEAWFRGDADSLEPVEAVLDPSFTIVGPDGSEMDRREILDLIAAGHGNRSGLRISTCEHRLLDETQERLVAAYVEVHEVDGSRTQRHSTGCVRGRRRCTERRDLETGPRNLDDLASELNCNLTV